MTTDVKTLAGKWWIEVAVIALILTIVGAAWANAASLRICLNDASLNADVAKVRVEANGAPLYEDILPGSTVSSRCVGGPVDGVVCTAPSTCGGGTCIPKRCNVQPVPAAMVRGTNLAITLRGVNAFEEVGPASNALAFRAPLTPPAIEGATLSVVTP